MPLDDYRRKRDFHRTPEPAGSGPRSGVSRQFVVHKYQARRLRYDLLLELQGVLKSWAVPKKPSCQRALKSSQWGQNEKQPF